MVDKISSPEKILKIFLAENTLPCFAYVKKLKNNEESIINNNTNENDKETLTEASSEKIEEIYFIETFESDCIFARSYSASFEQMLLNQRTSFAQSDIDNLTWASNYLTLTQNRKNLISEEVVIPFGYEGLFEMFSTNSTKLGGILDHETDIITLASRFTKPACYYVAKELNVYEICNEKTSSLIYKYLNSFNLLQKDEKQTQQYNRKWTKFPVGTICKVIRVFDIDCFSDTNFYVQMCRAIFCCHKSKNKSEMVIEFRIVENFDEIMKPEESPNDSNTKKYNGKLSEKSYYIPVDVDNPNKSIDLIPIAPVNKNVIVKNSLQTIKNFERINLVENPIFEVKLFAENLFHKPKKFRSDSKLNQSINSEMCKMNLKLEMAKFSSIFEAYESEQKSKFLVGYNLNSQQLFFSNIAKTNTNSKFTKMSDTHMKKSSMVQKFQRKLDLIKRLTDLKVSCFNLELNKLETFNDENSKLNEQSKAINTRNNITISHFADLINCDFKKGSMSQKSVKLSRFKIEKKVSDYIQSPIANQLKFKESCEQTLKLPIFKLKKYHSQNNINLIKPILLSQDILIRVNEKMPHLQLDYHALDQYFENKFETLKSLEFISTSQQSKQIPQVFQLKRPNSTNLLRTRSRSLPSIFFVFNERTHSSCCKKNIL